MSKLVQSTVADFRDSGHSLFLRTRYHTGVAQQRDHSESGGLLVGTQSFYLYYRSPTIPRLIDSPTSHTTMPSMTELRALTSTKAVGTVDSDVRY
jgi:hypothetical protein